MNSQDLFIGGLAVVLGALALMAAIGNWDRCYQFDKMRWIEARVGRTAARAAYAAGGILLIALGFAIALGFGLNKAARGASGPRTSRPLPLAAVRPRGEHAQRIEPPWRVNWSVAER